MEDDYDREEFADDDMFSGAEDGLSDDEDDGDKKLISDENLARMAEFELKHNYFKYLRRPDVNVDKICSSDIEIMVLDVDSRYEIERGRRRQYLRIFGINKDQVTFMVKVTGFFHYFYVKDPRRNQSSTSHKSKMPTSGGTVDIPRILSNLRFPGEGDEAVSSFEEYKVVEKESLLNYKSETQKKQKFLKLYVSNPRHIPKIRDKILEDKVLGEPDESHSYENGISYPLRFMIDKNIVGMGWIKIPKKEFHFLNNPDQKSFCQIDIVTGWNHIQALPVDEPKYSSLAPMRVLCVTIKCAADKGFPTPDKHSVITIACIGKVHNRKKEDFNIIFQLKSCNPVTGAIVKVFDDEFEMIRSFEVLLRNYDPDVITGYNVISSDLTYLYERSAQLSKCPGNHNQIATRWSRIVKESAYKKRSKIKTKEMFNRECSEFEISGRVQVDMALVIMLDHKFTSYSLNNVSMLLLNEQKADLHHSLINALYQKHEEERKIIAHYCWKDAKLALKLMDTLSTLYHIAEMGRVTGVPPNMLSKRGQQIRVLSQLYRFAQAHNMIIPVMKGAKFNRPDKRGPKGYQGAHIIPPTPGFYKTPVATLDFASLYPSIMIAHNLCYSTLVPPGEVVKLSRDLYTTTPSGHVFVKKSTRKGILPMILEHLIDARRKAKHELERIKQKLKEVVSEKEKSELEILFIIYNGRQNAMKINANSVYGFTGAQVGSLTCIPIAESVTGFGREMIEGTQKMVQDLCKKDPLFKHAPNIIYGDTDSLMIHFGVDCIKTVMEYGRHLAKLVTQQYINPIKLEFEKVYYPLILLKKKKYAGLMWTSPDKWDSKDCKGIETVRRDNCLMVRKALEKVLDIFFFERSEEKAKSYIRSLVNDILNNQVDMSELVITKSLSKKVDFSHETGNAGSSSTANEGPRPGTYRAHAPHVMLAEKLAKRNPDNPPIIGDRVPFVVTMKNKSSKIFEKVEDPVFAMENGMPLDLDYYVENQLKKPILRLFEFLNNNTTIELFQGKHTLNITNQQQASKQKGIGFYAQAVTRCLHCKITAVEAHEAVCKNCKPREVDVFVKQMFQVKGLQEEYKYLWTECQNCTGTRFGDILCSNSECHIFYRRIRAYKDLETITEEMKRFYPPKDVKDIEDLL